MIVCKYFVVIRSGELVGQSCNATNLSLLQVDCHKTVTQREAKFTNFVEWRTHKLVYRCVHAPAIFAVMSSACKCESAAVYERFRHAITSSDMWDGRRYAGLFFTLCVDVNDNELGCLEAIHLFVEVLDQYFGNVCELDLVFNFHKVRTRLNLCMHADAGQ
jgi:hypothetical protein